MKWKIMYNKYMNEDSTYNVICGYNNIYIYIFFSRFINYKLLAASSSVP